MQPSHNLPCPVQLKKVWERFVSQGQTGPDVDPLVATSWKRCGFILNPRGKPRWTSLSPDALPLTLNRHTIFRAVALPIMEDIDQNIEGTDAVLLLIDNTTCILEMLGDLRSLRNAHDPGFRIGAFINESSIGTTAFSIALIDSVPAMVAGAEHLFECFHTLVTVAAPVFDPEGRSVGAIGSAGPLSRHSPQALGMVAAAAKAIENQLQAELLIREANARASELNVTLDTMSEGLLVLTAQGTIRDLNERGGELLGLRPGAVKGRPLAEYLVLPATLAQAASRGEELRDVGISFVINGTAQEFLVSLRIIRQEEGGPATSIITLRHIEEVHKLVTRLVGAQARLTLDDMIGHGPSALTMRRQVLASANARGCVLLSGEPGTSKNATARAIHNSGRRAGGPFLAINCRAIPRELILGEFLGFEAGAFNTVPSAGQPSKFELADGGTLYLDEVEMLPLEVQSALARVIESGEIIRLGGSRIIPVDVRVIASTETDLERLVAENTFNANLFYRLSTFVIKLLPLRERLEDMELLVAHLLERMSLQMGRQIHISKDALEALHRYPWPGNITELESMLERAALHCEEKTIELGHLPDGVRHQCAKTPGRPVAEPVRRLAEMERQAIINAGRASRGNLGKTAQLLGIGRTTLWRKLKEAKMSTKDLKKASVSQ
ncbi:MAG TPA: sigma 54-interacting transcriptional regulator [Syntrophorhabdaceae bacterium]|nr:sigma 54-interacting transcriptional regulator [Syntrophorhabdaceae bacterium]HQM82402.1 sigma 54-interacting transcriptional regulator [Syntrophorhabdaceae bacterium]